MSYLFRSFTTFEVIDQETGEVIYKEVSEPTEVDSLSKLLGLSGAESVDVGPSQSDAVSEEEILDTTEDALDASFTEDEVVDEKDDIFADVSIPAPEDSESSDDEPLDASELEEIDDLADTDDIISLSEGSEEEDESVDEDQAIETDTTDSLDDVFDTGDLSLDLSEDDESEDVEDSLETDEPGEDGDTVSFDLSDMDADEDADDVDAGEESDDDDDDITSRRSNVDSLF